MLSQSPSHKGQGTTLLGCLARCSSRTYHLKVTSDFSLKSRAYSCVRLVLNRCLGMMKRMFSLGPALALGSAPGQDLVQSERLSTVIWAASQRPLRLEASTTDSQQPSVLPHSSLLNMPTSPQNATLSPLLCFLCSLQWACSSQ